MAVKPLATAKFKELREEIALEEVKQAPRHGFAFKGFDSLQRPLDGKVPFETADEARFRLETAGIKLTELKPVSEHFKRKRDKKPNMLEMAHLAEMFASQKEIGLTYDRICRILGRVHPNLAVKRALESVANRIQFGQTAYEAFSLEKDKKGNPFFPLTFVNAFRLGDEIGALPDPETEQSADAPVVMLRFFAQGQRKAGEMFKKIKGALVYPVSIITAVIVAFFIEVYWIVPIFANMFVGLLQGKNAALPFATQLMLDISAFFQSGIGIAVTFLFFIGMGASIYYFFFTKQGIEKRDRAVLRLPLLKSFYLPFYASIFCRDLSMMWASEPNLTRRFAVVAETSVNPVFREMAEHFQNQVPQGTSIGQLFNPYFGLLGESFAPIAETIENAPGDGQKQLYSYAKYLEADAAEKLELAIAVLGKLAFFFAAGMVVFILIASYSPLIELVGKMSQR